MMRERAGYGRHVAVRALAIVAAPLVAAVVLAWRPGGSPAVRLAAVLAAAMLSGAAVILLLRAVRRPLRVLANLLGGLRRGDFTLRSALSHGDDDWSLVMAEANALADTLGEQRLGALEANALLRKVMAEIEVAVFAFDDARALRLVNRTGERWLGLSRERIEARTAESLGLAEFLEGPAPRTVELAFPGAVGRGELRRSDFRQHGRPHVLVVVSDLSRVLRQEELEAWRKLVRVLSHEINNSLTPIASVAASLRSLARREPRPEDYESDLGGGLALIEARAESLRRFMASYARLARLPTPRRERLRVGELVARVAGLHEGVTIEACADGELEADPDQLEQLLLNLLANAVDAAGEVPGAGVRVAWTWTARELCLRVVDDGLGLANSANVFVPFFSTKPGGSGIGLALSRQIAESHGGSVVLRNRGDARGCEAIVRLPIVA
ncbi:MAG: PAS domain-containing sensor histidine kinase [Deltaproteobacteria bacterium]|nr:PAS domain-containing sensor histidine kinase [Deltaproteobacteria bacterium]MBK8240029.1 PAS domain-containing sensor histidine kinase [Deltaproteobacteria bacterium]MBK8715981.1 PAS domain-containing sensor histidine kinase [Deltaproteobacteria bacterium]MBP7289895.1 PAS domain-containing sensor histidine kinase [Nannocystaceae bacterium]